MEYETSASQFLTKPRDANLMECIRTAGSRNGDRVRYDTATMEFGVLASAGFILTYFKPIPCSAPGALLRPGCHGYPDNVTYFTAQC